MKDTWLMKRLLFIIPLLALIAVACSPQAASTPTEVATTVVPATELVPTEEEMQATTEPTPIPATEESAPAAPAAYSGPDWTQLTLTNSRTGETFTLADFAGKTVWVEPMASWCTNCLGQQKLVREAIAELGADASNYVFISLSVEPNDNDTIIAEYAERNEFAWLFAVATPDMVLALVEQYGRTITSPPSTPHFILGPAGTASDLSTGRHSSKEIREQLATARGV